MRIMIKGGVWKNTEDEILKAAVMKYGKNQWARISSLLVRKSAKQCKARWYEWLDPSIKKTEWTREEDEKLLHLAKLMPTQWRTIAPIVGRTPVQCLERYEKLLDAAMSKGDEGYEGNDDPRRLRPGEIDPNPESKPARPDPVDMDEDEKEMLSEARARLANTLGKKAKRKAREKQLEEARRLASLQKRRELKAAGIDMGGRKRKLKGIDYNAEIPFEHAPQAGFFDVTAENERTAEVRNQPFKPTTLAELDGKRRKDMEDNLAKLDTRRQQVLARNDMPKHLDQIAGLNDGEQVRKRSKLMLPTPQVSEGELAELAKMGEDGGVDPALLAGAGGDATQGLIGNYTQTPNRTPMRTPMRTPSSGQDTVLVEAANLAALQSTQTPLAGGEGPDLSGSDFSGVTPRRKDAPTPNVIATPLRTPAGGVGATPLRTPMVGPGATPLRTPLRDAMGINDPDSMGAPGTRQEERARLAGQREELRSGFASLPAPKNEYQITIPELPEQVEAVEEFEEDAADRDARRAEAEAAAVAREMAKRSHCLQRGLPRPVSLALAPSGSDAATVAAMAPLDRAAALIASEMRALLEHDAARYPIKVSKKDKAPRPAAPPIETIEPEEMEAAAGLVAAEAEGVRAAMGHDGVGADEYAATWESCMADIMYLPSAQRYGRAASATNADKLAAVQGDFAAAKAEVEKAAKRATKLEQKVQVLTAGLAQRGAGTCRRILEVVGQLESARTELQCFRALHAREELAGPARIQGLMEEVVEQQQREKDLQAKFKRLTHQRALLAEALAP